MADTILITGGAGFIGSHLGELLMVRGDRVVALDNLNDYYDPAIKRGKLAILGRSDRFSFEEGDIRDRDNVRRILDEYRPDAIVHLAAMAGVRPSIERPVLYADVNVRGTAILLEEAVQRKMERFVFVSSSSVYGERKNAPFSESDRVDFPISPYAATKKAGELLCHTFHHCTGMSVSCLRYFTVYGPRQRPEMAIHMFTRKVINGETLPVFGDGSSARDYTYVADIADGTARALDRCKGYRIYNLGGSGVTKLSRLLEVISEATGCEAKIESLPMQMGDVSLTAADITLARAELGWEPQTAIESGVRMFVDWYREKTA